MGVVGRGHDGDVFQVFKGEQAAFEAVGFRAFVVAGGGQFAIAAAAEEINLLLLGLGGGVRGEGGDNGRSCCSSGEIRLLCNCHNVLRKYFLEGAAACSGQSTVARCSR
ncbi:MAG: hypothetical protein M5U34_05245 [Chloroflexi bacterium]|nr:hypothetical protein [Chloroflexota bacterium]